MSERNRIIRPISSEPAISRYLNQKGCNLGLPISGNFELTSRCNFNCKMCYVHSQNNPESLKSKELTADQWLSLASDARDLGMVFLLLTGGEPFLRADFAQIYRELRKMGLMISINTNAALYNDEIHEVFQQHPPTRLNVSLYGASNETYEKICGNASFEKVIKNLKWMKSDRLQVRLNVSLTPDNVADLEGISNLSNELGMHAKATSYMYPPVRVSNEIGTNAGRFSAEEAGIVLAKWKKVRDSKDAFIDRCEQIKKLRDSAEKITAKNAQPRSVQCRAGRSSFWLTWDGKMLPCGVMDVEPALPLMDGFEQAWTKVKETTKRILLPEECSICKYRSMCGVCAANCKAETGIFSKKPEYLCRMVESQCHGILDMI